ncbi:MAG TPA: hypothetical protein VGT04_09430, partial [Acidobacteriaceae bacterium]|nr:hypothetical protein [Acidobacteriaceae bacterium]
ERTKILSLNVVVKNRTDKPLTGPFKLAVLELYKHYGFAAIANADNKASGAGAVWNISSVIPIGGLGQEATSKPFTMRFRYVADPSLARDNSDDIFGLYLKVYAKP